MREIIKINQNWYFTKDNTLDFYKDKDKFENLNLPYTWNGKDGQDGGNDYYRGKCLFVKCIKKDEMPKGDEIYLQFDGVNSECVVLFNKKEIFSHEGGYSTFRVKLENILEDNIVEVFVTNAPSDRVYPQVADFTFYGGIYRDVSLIGVCKNHFDLDYFGGPGIMVTPSIENNLATVAVEAFLGNIDDDCILMYQIEDKGEILSAAKVEKDNLNVNLIIENVHLWNGIEDPYLYTARAKILKGDEVCDEISTKFGCRTFKIDPNNGFILNGKEYPLRGVSRHQDRPDIGNALLYEHHKEDIDLIMEVGANTVRLAHYQHSQDFYNLCDEKGLIIWAEIPYISNHMENGKQNTVSQMTELIIQNYNHPSIVVWGLSNEITMSGSSQDLVANHLLLNDMVHLLDKTRLTTVAVVTMTDPKDPYTNVSDVISYNHYFGWYGGNVNMYGPWFDDYHKKYPNRAVGLSEYGCEALNWHTSKPEQGDYTEEYQAYYHEELIKQIAERKYLWATHVWNMFDFAADARAEGGENGMNHKGLVTFDRKYKKDAFYAYKAWLSKEPVLHICGKRYVDRVEDVTKVTVYCNEDEVTLYVNGQAKCKQLKGKYPFFYFEVENIGESEIVCKSNTLEDKSFIRKVDKVNEDYIMKEAGDVINWFDITAPDGYLSINDTIGEIFKTFRGKLALISVLLKLKKKMGQKSKDGKKTNVMGFKINKTIIEIAKGFPLKRVLSMTGGLLSKDETLVVNKKLNKIKKKK